MGCKGSKANAPMAATAPASTTLLESLAQKSAAETKAPVAPVAEEAPTVEEPVRPTADADVAVKDAELIEGQAQLGQQAEATGTSSPQEEVLVQVSAEAQAETPVAEAQVEDVMILEPGCQQQIWGTLLLLLGRSVASSAHCRKIPIAPEALAEEPAVLPVEVLARTVDADAAGKDAELTEAQPEQEAQATGTSNPQEEVPVQVSTEAQAEAPIAPVVVEEHCYSGCGRGCQGC